MKKNKTLASCIDLPLDFDCADSFCETAAEFQSIPDALVSSIHKFGRVNMKYILSVTGEPIENIIKSLKGSVYQNPETWNSQPDEGWETANEYLTGNLMRKLSAAQKANKKHPGLFDANIKAIQKVLPPAVDYSQIYITLGTPWVPPDIIDDFIKYLFGRYIKDYDRLFSNAKTKHDPSKGKWEIPEKNRFNNTPQSISVSSTYGTEHLNALHIIEKTLNQKTIVIKEVVDDPVSKSKITVVKVNETELAKEKQNKIIAEFRDWVWKDQKRKKRLEGIFENLFGGIVRRTFDGSFLTFPDMSDKTELYQHQKDAVARIIFTPNTLLAHEVGAGKTYVMIAAGMELRRMGISRKNIYVVPNNVVNQWEQEFITLYPKANILTVKPNKFAAQARNRIIAKMRDNDYDAIIIAYSCFNEILPSKEYYETFLKNTIKKETKKAEKAEKANNENEKKKSTAKIKQLKDELKNLDNRIYFDQLGVNTLFVDEAHNFKNLETETKITYIVGMSKNGSEKCNTLLEKIRHIQAANNGRGVVFATGTPITNSMSDLYVIQRYLQQRELSLVGLKHFDEWVGMFADKEDNFEIEVDTSKCKISSSFCRFKNLEVLNNLLALITDMYCVDRQNGIPDFDGHTDVVILPTKGLKSFLENISLRADKIKAKEVKRTEDNMLKITIDGRTAALDLRLVDEKSEFSEDSKIYRCAENAARIFTETSPQKSTQVIFCDIGTPKDKFNIYDELADTLVSMGVPRETIAYIHDAKTEKERSAIFKKVRTGDIRIIIGSTLKLGMGVNIQNKLVALHHLDVPWKPSDMVQREGRILRQGNTNKKVYIFRYITEKSFDAYSWQLLEKKQKFITQILFGDLNEKSCSDIDNTVLDYAEVKALAINNPQIKDRVETANEIERCKALQRGVAANTEKLRQEQDEARSSIADIEKLIAKAWSDRIFYQKQSRWDYDDGEKTYLQTKIFDAVKKNCMKSSERDLIGYKGFKVILPANMTPEKPYIILKNEGRYTVRLGESEKGILIRIKNCLNRLDKHIEKLHATIDKLSDKIFRIESEIDNQHSYIDKIDALELKLKIIDERLGIKNERN